MTIRLPIIISIILLIFLSSPVFALGKLSHQLVCQLSYDLLPITQQQKIDDLLVQLSDDDKNSINTYNRNKKGQEVTFADSCTWADAIKKNKTYDRYKPWHYLNIERNASLITKETCAKDCITSAIPYHNNQLKQATNLQDKVEALMFLGHWLGDIHQPLHVSFASDYGGNRNKITPLVGRCENLHWYWDECLLYPLPKTSDKKSDKFNYLAFKTEIYNTLSEQLISSPKGQWEKSNAIDWANESLTIIRGEAFSYCQIKGDNCSAMDHKKVTISKAYHQNYQTILHERILQAAVRLSAILNKSL